MRANTVKKALMILALAGAATTSLAACSGTQQGQHGSATATQPISTAAAPTSADPHQGKADQVAAALKQLVAANPKPSTDQVRQTLSQFTQDPAAIEVSQSKTPTGLDADSLQAAVKVDGACVVSGIRSGATAIVIMPPLGTGSCFAGDQR